jgi:hypothetical protein
MRQVSKSALGLIGEVARESDVPLSTRRRGGADTAYLGVRRDYDNGVQPKVYCRLTSRTQRQLPNGRQEPKR